MSAVKTQLRHIDKGVLLGSFADEALAICPKCAGPALVTCETRFPFRPTSSRLCCLKCSCQKVGSELGWHGPVKGTAKARCPHCGFKWLEGKYTHNSFSQKARRWTGITCSSCQRTTKVEIVWRVDRMRRPVDPAFGLPLWLQSPCCGEILWGYNSSHLRSLRDYIAAGLRERTNGLHWSMFQRLPKWMSAHKNRDAVLACLDRLEKKAVSVQSEPRKSVSTKNI
jgi:hypothetical protein